jgi:hypothetical protein
MSYHIQNTRTAGRQELSMKTMQVRSHVGADGMWELKLPSGLSETDVDVVVVMSPVAPSGWKSEAERQEWQDFVKRTAGSIQDPTFFRHEQNE